MQMLALQATSLRNPQKFPPFMASQPVQHTQKTLLTPASCQGVGVHSGNPVTMTLRPAPVGSGITFVRTDLGKALIKASWKTVVDTRFCTTIGNQNGVTVSTVEHLFAALAAMGIDNLRIELNGPELPIMDGCSEFFLTLLEQTGVRDQQAPRQMIRVLKTVTVSEGNRSATLSPSSFYELEVDFDFGGRIALETQHLVFRPSRDSFHDLIAPARTFGLLEDAEKLRAAGLAKGASLDNTVVYDGSHVLNEEGLRYEDECARHKILDAMGDLHLAGGMILGKFHGLRAGHGLHCQLLKALFADPTAYFIESSAKV